VTVVECDGKQPTAQDVKAWLERGRTVMAEIDALSCARAAAEERARGLRAGPHSRAGSGRRGRGDWALVSLADYGARIGAKTAELAGVLSEITAAINAVGDGNQRLVLLNRYVLGKAWGRIAEDMGYGWRHVHRLHSQAVAAVACSVGWPPAGPA
jgi:hypothetical protein